MGSIQIYGIPNCDSVKRARKWLAAHGVAYIFHDFKKEGVDEKLLRQWVAAIGWEALLNRRGMMWRKLTDAQRTGLDEGKAMALMLEIPTIIKRPVLLADGHVEVGFSDTAYQKLFDQRG